MSKRGNSGFVDIDKRFGTENIDGELTGNTKGTIEVQQQYLERTQGRGITPPLGPASDSTIWLDMASENVSITSGRVTNWLDKSGNNHDAVEVSSSGPTWNSSDSEFNNLPSGNFLASDYLEITDSTDFDLNGTGGFTLYMVLNWNGGGGTFSQLIQHANGTSWTQGWGVLYYNGDIRFWVNSWNTSSQRAQVVWSNTTNTHILKFHYDQTTITGQMFGPNAISDTQAYTTAVTDAADNLDIGRGGSSTYEWSGDIAEIIFWNRPLDSNEQTKTEEYLSDKYNISLT
jgi:hypothetical protein